jgi:hypothetical protein
LDFENIRQRSLRLAIYSYRGDEVVVCLLGPAVVGEVGGGGRCTLSPSSISVTTHEREIQEEGSGAGNGDERWEDGWRQREVG